MTAKLVLARHAQSEGNLKNIFTGLSDLPLSDHGRDEALDIAARLRDAGIRPAVVYTSALSRTRETAVILLDALGIDATMIADPALNERDYGDLTGMNKAEAVARFGADRVLSWRRSYDDRPPGGESLADTRSRVWPFFENVIAPHLQAAENVLVIAHGTSSPTGPTTPAGTNGGKTGGTTPTAAGLASTGFDGAGAMSGGLAAAALLILGAGALLVRRRKNENAA